MQHTTSRDYYGALGVSSTASSEEIRGAFRRLARTHHPDLNPQDRQAAARFKEINEAHEILSDPGKRRQYDERRARRTVPAEWPGPLFGRFEAGFAQQRFQLDDLLGDILGFGSTRSLSELLDAALGAHRPPPRSERQPRRGQDAEAEIVLSLEEAARGTTGTLEVTAPFGRRQVRICIPAGVAHGALVRAAGLGTAGVAGGAAGDLLLRVSILAHPVFRRVGDHLHVRVEVPSDLARVGGAVGVPTLGGQRARLDVPPGTETGLRLRLRGLGMPRLGCGGHGDLVAEVKVRPLQGRSRDDGVSAHTHPHPGEAPQHGG